MGKADDTAATIATHAAGRSVGIIIYHLKVEVRVGAEEHEPVGTDTEAAVAPVGDVGLIELFVEVPGPVVQENKIVTGAVVFVERNQRDRIQGS